MILCVSLHSRIEQGDLWKCPSDLVVDSLRRRLDVIVRDAEYTAHIGQRSPRTKRRVRDDVYNVDVLSLDIRFDLINALRPEVDIDVRLADTV